MSRVRIDLSFEDLEKILVDENGEIPLEIRQGVAQTFSDRYLKGIITESLQIQFDKSIKEIGEAAVWEFFELRNNWNNPMWLKDESKKLIESYVKMIIENEISAFIADIKNNMSNQINESYELFCKEFKDIAIEHLIDDRINVILNYRLKKLI